MKLGVDGIAFWSTWLPDWQTARAMMRGELTEAPVAATRPQPTLLAPTERRRAPDTVALALEVASRACEAAGRSPADVPAVFASTHGDTAISDYMCATLASTPTLISPVKFHNSVHNAAAGYWSIGTHSFAPYTAVSAYVHTFGAGLLECATQALCSGNPHLYVAFDIEAKGPLGTQAASRGLLAVGLVLNPSPSGNGTQIELALSDSRAVSRACSPAAALLADNALAPCVPFMEALANETPATVVLSLGDSARLQVRLGS